MKELLLPQEEKAESISNFVIVGANGSGKSHLGAWLEKHKIRSILCSEYQLRELLKFLKELS